MTEQLSPAPEPSSSHQPPIQQLIAQYHASLDVIEAETSPNPEQIALVLTVRDAIHVHLLQQTPLSPPDLTQLTTGDQRFQTCKGVIATVGLLDQWRQTVQPTPEQWWWFVQTPPTVDVWDRLDWLWNVLTVAGLAGFAANMTSVIPLLFASGLSFLESLGLIGPSGLVALIASRMNKGEQSVSAIRRVLKFLGIPRRFQSEFAALVALVLFTGAYTAKEHLPNHYFKHFVQKGRGFYEQGQLRMAKQAYEQALAFSEDESIRHIGKIYADLGIISEAVNDYDVAIAHYLQALNDGEFDVLNNLGRVLLNQGRLVEAEAALNLGVMRSNPEDFDTQYQFRRNLGWVYFKQSRYDEAIATLNQAITYQNKMSGIQPGYGIAYCLQAATYQSQEPPQLAKSAVQWRHCQQWAFPETLAEYEVIIRYNPDLAGTINTFAIFD